MTGRTPESTPSPFGLSSERIERFAENPGEGACWSCATDDLDVNLVAWSPSHGVAAHTNSSVDVLVVGVFGEGTIEIDGRTLPLAPGEIHLVPRGSRRAIHARTRLLYLTCHRRRPREFSTEELF